MNALLDKSKRKNGTKEKENEKKAKLLTVSSLFINCFSI